MLIDSTHKKWILLTAIVAAATQRRLALGDPVGFDSPTGKGALGTVDGRAVVLGNTRFLAERGVDVAPLSQAADELRRALEAAMKGILEGGGEAAGGGAGR